MKYNGVLKSFGNMLIYGDHFENLSSFSQFSLMNRTVNANATFVIEDNILSLDIKSCSLFFPKESTVKIKLSGTLNTKSPLVKDFTAMRLKSFSYLSFLFIFRFSLVSHLF